MQTKHIGRYIETKTNGELVRAFVPPPLPPSPPLRVERFYKTLDRANQAIGRLDGLQAVLPNVGYFLYLYTRREAVLSSQIEGTQSTLSELLLFEQELLQPTDDLSATLNYVAAMEHGLKRIREGFPLSNRLLREMHGILLRSGRGADRTPGDFRTMQNWFGGSRPGNAKYVPPPVPEMLEVMSDLERYLHRETAPMPLLIDAGIAHVQFESAHPFQDGNGRIGRLLVTLLLCERGVLKQPTLYLSLYLKQNRDQYYDLLQAVRMTGAWEDWIEFFLEGVCVTAEEACNTAAKIRDLFESDRKRIKELAHIGSALRLHDYFQQHPVTDLQQAAGGTETSHPTMTTAMGRLVDLGIAREITNRKRGRVFVYQDFMKMLDDDAESGQ